MKLNEHPAFQSIDSELVNSIQEMLDSSAKKNNPYDTLQGLIGVNNTLKKHNIPITPDMQKALIIGFKDTLPKAKRKQFEAFFNAIYKGKF